LLAPQNAGNNLTVAHATVIARLTVDTGAELKHLDGLLTLTGEAHRSIYSLKSILGSRIGGRELAFGKYRGHTEDCTIAIWNPTSFALSVPAHSSDRIREAISQQGTC